MKHLYFFFIISLNQEKRRRELLRVSKENATLAKRIIERKPESRDAWKYSWSKNTSYLDSIAKYDPDWHLSKVNSYLLSKNFCYISLFSLLIVKHIMENLQLTVRKVRHVIIKKVLNLLL